MNMYFYKILFINYKFNIKYNIKTIIKLNTI